MVESDSKPTADSDSKEMSYCRDCGFEVEDGFEIMVFNDNIGYALCIDCFNNLSDDDTDTL